MKGKGKLPQSVLDTGEVIGRRIDSLSASGLRHN